MENIINLSKAKLNRDYIIKNINRDDKSLKNYGIYVGARVTPLYRSFGKSISAYKTYYGVFAFRNDLADNILVENG